MPHAFSWIVLCRNGSNTDTELSAVRMQSGSNPAYIKQAKQAIRKQSGVYPERINHQFLGIRDTCFTHGKY